MTTPTPDMRMARAANVVALVNARFPQTAGLWTTHPTGASVVVTVDLADVRTVLDLVSGVAIGRATEQPSVVTVPADGFSIRISHTVSIPTGLDVLTRVLLDLDDRCGGTLTDILASVTPIPGDLADATPWHQLSDDWQPGTPDGLVLAWLAQALHVPVLPAAEPLDAAGDVLRTLLTDIVTRAGWPLDHGYLWDVTSDILEGISDLADEGHGITDVARRLAEDTGPAAVRVPVRAAAPASTRQGRS